MPVIEFNLEINQLDASSLQIQREEVENLTIERDTDITFNIVQLDEFNVER